jgi:glycosyltransferase involved in cell wall biosynthesis
MKIAQVSPLFESVPPKLYGGTERVVSFLTEELVRQGHEVTLFASGDSQTAARLVPMCERSLRLQGDRISDPTALQVRTVELVLQQAEHFDVLHFHTDYLQFPALRRLALPAVTTEHGRLDTPELKPLFSEFWEMKLVSISNAQRAPIPDSNWVATVYHGLPADSLSLNQSPEDYLAFMGRISPEKRVDRAIEIAKRSGRKLKIAAKIDAADKIYFEREIKHLFDQPHVEYLGELGDEQKGEFLGKAAALLFPIDWPEPFGLVMIEAMACGTPVIAFPCGSVPELVESGKTGFVVNDIEQAVAAVDRLREIDRAGCRRGFEERFTAERMATSYLEVYRQVIGVSRTGIAGVAA